MCRRCGHLKHKSNVRPTDQDSLGRDPMDPPGFIP